MNDEQMFTSLMDKPSSKRAHDENSAFSQFRNYVHRMLTVAIKKGVEKVAVGRLCQGAVDAGLFKGVEHGYRRAYNYFLIQKEDLPEGWKVGQVNKRNHVIFSK